MNKTKSSAISRRTLLTALGLGTTGVVLAACSSGAESNSDGTPQSGGEVTFLITNLASGWVSNKTSGDNFVGQVWANIADKLVYLDAEGNTYPWLLESWDENEDVTQVTLHLKDGITFSDGDPLNASAVKANIEYWNSGDTEAGIPRVSQFPTTYTSSEIIDDLTLKVNFSQPTLSFVPHLGALRAIILSPKNLTGSISDQADLGQKIGTGPFVVESWKENEEVVLTRREDYNWGVEAAGLAGASYLEKVTYKVLAEETVRVQSVTSGQANVAYDITPQELDSYKDQGYTVKVPRYIGFASGFRIQTQAPNVDDVRVRQALQHAIDRDEILSTVYNSDWLPATSFVQGNVPEVGDYTDLFSYDPDTSNSLLDEAGWTLGDDGYRYKDGQALEIPLYPTPYLTAAQQIDELVSKHFKAIGVKSDIQKYDISAWSTKVSGNSDVPLQETTISFADIGVIPGLFGSKAKNGSDWFALDGADTDLEGILDELKVASDREARKEIFHRLEEHVLTQAYFIPLTQLVQRIYVIDPKLQGVVFDGTAIADYHPAWLEA